MKHINNETEFVVILTGDEIQNLMACCNAARIRWNEMAETDKDWETMRDIADKCWDELYDIKNPGKEV